jgi:penicillin-binding protein 1A
MVDGKETTLLENEPQKERVIKESTAYYMNSMLQNVVTSGTGTGAQLSNMTAAGKTGTTSENHDRWFVGYTPYYTAAVWTGYPYNAKMSGSNRAVELWKKVMSQVHQGLSNKSFPQPDGLKSVTYCLDSGYLATDYCKLDPRGSRVASDYVFQEDFPEGLYCTVHTADSLVSVCTDSPILDSDGDPTGLYHIAGPYCPEDSLTRMCLPDYVREHIGTATAQDERYRKSVVESYGTCTVHTEAPVAEEPPEEDEEPDDQTVPPSWLGVLPWEQPTTDPDDVTNNEPSDIEDDEPENGLDLPQTGQEEDVPVSEDA